MLATTKTTFKTTFKTKFKTLVLFFLMALLLTGAGYFQYRYDGAMDYFASREVFVTLPSGKALRILSFGYRGLVADMLFIWAIQFYSNYYQVNMYHYLEHIFNTITDLTPTYKEPYLVGSWIMALEAENVYMAIRLLRKGSAAMPDEWIFDYECGFYAFKDLKDYELAEEFFAKAAAKPSAPPIIARKRAHMVYMKDDLNYAYELWTDVYKKATSKLERKAALNHLQQIQFEMDRNYVERGVARFRQQYGRNPMDLEELRRTGILQRIPRDYAGRDYIYLPQKGTITARKVFRWKK